MTDEGADEVKVFRRTDAEDLETNAQSSHQLAEDKKDVVLETELETRPNGDPLIGQCVTQCFIRISAIVYLTGRFVCFRARFRVCFLYYMFT
ncbi:unnamed protein product [Cylicostephanus goldi]|uniref:Uncharacterized protein n=1 Tax=Cylicostephanus goldi TaxID=71465 RepID=A0A3P7QHA0_CYLGO|nr:unnamed protein product [Cylicostephanus goldi]